MQSEDVVRALAALAQDHRLAAFLQLVEAGQDGVPAGVMAERLGVPPSSMSFHLGQLVHSGLANQRREGRSIIYQADYTTMNGLMSFLTQNCCGGADCAANTAALADCGGQAE